MITARASRLFRNTICVKLLFGSAAILTSLLALPMLGAEPQTLNFVVSNEVALAGGYAQIKVRTAIPRQIVTGYFEMSFDPAVVSNVVSASAFGAKGDASAAIQIGGQTLSAFFSSPSGSVGQLPDLPLLVVNVKLRSDAAPGTVGAATLTPRAGSAFDPSGSAFVVSATSGSVTVGGSLSIQEVTPGGGLWASGKTIRVIGNGFTPASQLVLDGVPISAPVFVSPNEIDFQLTGSTELSGKKMRVRNPGGESVTYYLFLKPQMTSLVTDLDLTPFVPALPNRDWTSPFSASTSSNLGGVAVIQNADSSPHSVSVDSIIGNTPAGRQEVSIPASGYVAIRLNNFAHRLTITPSAPVRAAVFGLCGLCQGDSLRPEPVVAQTGTATQSLLAAVVNAGSQLQSEVSPGEILSIHGLSVGSTNVRGFSLDSSGKVSTIADGVQILFDGKAAPLIYSSATQSNVIVPYEVAGRVSTRMEIAVNGVKSQAWDVPVSATSPAIFTDGSLGVGQGAILNQDHSANSASNPAMRGSVIQIFATGEGQTTPSGITASVTNSSTIRPIGDVKVTIGGVSASIRYAGSAPSAVAGLFQVNAVVPEGVLTGQNVPIIVTVGGISSQSNVTVAVQ